MLASVTTSATPAAMIGWAEELLDSMIGICELLDAGHPDRPYSATLKDQQVKLEDVEQTPSARLLRELRAHGEGFSRLALRYSVDHRVGGRFLITEFLL